MTAHAPTSLAHREPKPAKPKPTHYKIVCFSMYIEDIAALDAKVAELKRRGWTKASKSQLIRIALKQLDIGGLDQLSKTIEGIR